MFITAMGGRSKRSGVLKRVIAVLTIAVIFITSAFSVAALSKTAVITVDGEEITVSTLSKDTFEILESAGIELAANDEVIRYDNTDNNIAIIVNRAFEVLVNSNSGRQSITVTGGTVADALKKAGVTPGSNDMVTPKEDTKLKAGLEITVCPFVILTVRADGKTTTEMVPEGTVENALDFLNIKLNKNDRLNVKKTEQVTNEMIIKVDRITYKTVTKTEAIKYAVNETPSEELYEGETEVVSKGENGERTLKVKQTYVNGKLSDEKVLEKKVTKKAVAEEVLVGTKVKANVTSTDNSAAVQTSGEYGIPSYVEDGVLYDASGNQVPYKNVLYGSGTAYYAEPGALTATGTPAYVGGVAVNPNIIPYGTNMFIVSEDGFVYGYATAIDTGGALMDGTALVDCFYPTYDDCVVFGRRNVYVYILD